MPGRGSTPDLTCVVDKVALAEAEDPTKFAAIRAASLSENAIERMATGQEDINQLARRYGTDLNNGLNTVDASIKLEQYGPNLLTKTAAKSYWRILAEQVNILNMLVVGAGVLCYTQHLIYLPGSKKPLEDEPDIQNGTILFVIVGLCMIVGAYMEWTCSRIMADVSAMSAPTCQVVRDGMQQTCDAANIVPGDIVVLTLGDVIPADMRVIEITDMLTNEMPLTGEPHDITKTVTAEDEKAPFPSNMLYATTNVVNGGGRGIVLHTGMNTEMGKIAEHLQGEEVGLTSVQKTMNQIGRLVTFAMLALVFGIFCISFFGRVDDPNSRCGSKDNVQCYLKKSIIRCLFNAVGAIPETLQPAAMVLLVMGCRQMMKVKVQTRKLAAVDTLGSCSFICSDKTGTLTEGKMTCMCFMPRLRVLAPKVFAFYPTRGFDPSGGIYDCAALDEDVKRKIDEKARGETVNAASLPENYGDPEDPKGPSPENRLVHATMLALYLNSYGTKLVEETQGVYTIQGNMSEGALVVAAAKAGFKNESDRANYLRDSNMEVPFSSSRKMMATVHRLSGKSTFEALSFPNCTHLAIIKGAPDKLLPFLTSVLTPFNDGASFVADASPFDESDKQWFGQKNEELSSQALRVLAVAVAPLGAAEVSKIQAATTSEERMDVILSSKPVLLGLLGLMDPPRESAKKAVEECHRAGMRVAMITGDQKPTAMAIARDLGIVGNWVGKAAAEEVATECSVLHGLKNNQAALDELCRKIVVWARAQPTDKVTIVESLQRQGHVVAMTGDGVNDAGALKKADIGVAMGIAGTDVAKGAADMVLMDDRFATIVDAVAEGRRIFGNIQKMVAYLLCVNIFEVIFIMFSMIFGWAVPLEDAQLFKANFITHEFYPWCMVMEAAGFYNMLQPPRDRSKTLIPRLMRNVLMVFVFFSYISIMLTTQAMASYMYCGTVSLDSMLGTESIKAFDDHEGQHFSCLHAHSHTEKGWQKDDVAIACIVKTWSLGGWEEHREFGVGAKMDEKDARDKIMNQMDGKFGDMFDLKNSFLHPDLEKHNYKFGDLTTIDKYGWITRCEVEDDKPMKEVADGDHLCWKMCPDPESEDDEEKPCWELTGGKPPGARRLEDEEDDDDDDDDDADPRMPTLYPTFNCNNWGVRKMRACVLLSMVLTEFTMLYAFSKHEFGPPLVLNNMTFPIAWGPMLLGLLTLVYFPVKWWDNEFAPLDFCGVLVSIMVPTIFYSAFEGVKVLNRKWFQEELRNKMAVAELSAEGKLKAYAGVREARQQHPSRVPLVAQQVEIEMR